MNFYISDNALCETTNLDFTQLPLKWDLKNNQLWYGNIKNGKDIENKYLDCFGSIPFLYDECGTILFHKTTKN